MMNKETDIRKLLDKEIKKASHYFFPPEEQDNGLNKMKLVKTIVEEVNSRIKGKLSGFFVFNALLGLLDELSIEPIWANQIFNKIYSNLNSEQRKSKSDEEDADDYNSIIFELKLTAVSYFKKQIHRELKDDDLPKKLKSIKKTLAGIISQEDLFRREALIELQKEIEDEIVLRDEEISNRRKLSGQFNQDKLEEFDEKVDSILTKRQWLVALSFFVDAFKLRSINKINFSRLLTVMNNGKNYQDFRTKFGARDLITAKTANDAQKIADLFREFNLPEIAEDIENKINKLKL